MDNSINLRNERENERMAQWGAVLVYIQKGGYTDSPEHAGLKKTALLSTSLLSEVEGKVSGWPERPFSFSQRNFLANPTHFLTST